MKKNKVLVIVITLVASLTISCGDKNIVLNENTIIEQVSEENRLIVKEKNFNVESTSETSFEPYYIVDDWIYGIDLVKREFANGQFHFIPDNKLKRVSKDGVVENLEIEVTDLEELPFVVEEEKNSKFVYKNYITGEEKLLIEGSPKSDYSDYIRQSQTSIENYIIEDSPYAIIIKLIENDKKELNRNIDIFNVNTGERFSENIKLESNDITNETFREWNNEYFYMGEENVIYSISQESGIIKKINLKDGKIEEEEYDKLNNSLDKDYRYYKIYSNGEETRIIYDEESSNEIVSQSSYKVITKEHEELYNKDKGIGNLIWREEMLPNQLMIATINGEYTLIKFESDGIKLVYKFDFSDVLSQVGEAESMRASFATDESGKEIVVKLSIVNYDREIISEKFKIYEIIE